jgi:putative membrane-bound dehydrogenase-like protein
MDNRVLVSCSPNLILYTDTNRDDRADRKEILLTGFGGYDHDHSLHAVFAGPDGKWYFNAGNAGSHVVTDRSGWTLRSGSIYTGGSPYNSRNAGNQVSDDGKVWVGGLALRINPDGTGLRVMAHNFRNSYEVFPDSYGNLWQNDNDDQVVTCRTAWLPEGGNAGYFSTDGTRFWQADQRPGQDMFTAHWHQEDPGVMPAGDRTGAGAPTGILRYEGDLFGASGRGMLLSADAGRNVIFAYHPQPAGSGYHLSDRINWLSSLQNDNPRYVWNDSLEHEGKDKWFRPSDLAVGTDGSLFVADWYDPVVGGHLMKDSGGYGRIYRVTPKSRPAKAPVIDLETRAGQLEAFKSPAIHVRYAGYERLKAGGDAVLAELLPLLDDDNPFIRARTLWLIAALGPAGRKVAIQWLDDPEPLNRVLAVRALRQEDGALDPHVEKLAADTSARVRRELILAIPRINPSKRDAITLELAMQYPGNDRWYLEALGTLLDENPAGWYDRLKAAGIIHSTPLSWNAAMSDLAWRLHTPAALPDLLARIQDSTLPLPERYKMMTAIGFMRDSLAARAMLGLSRSADQPVAEMAVYWLSFRHGNDWFDLMDWKTANINAFAARRLALMKFKRQVVLDSSQSLEERKWRINEMARDSVGGQMLVALAAEQKLSMELMPFIAAVIFNNPDLHVRLQAGKYFNRPGSSGLLDVAHILSLKPDPGNGRLLFLRQCGICHRNQQAGAAVGPDLTGIGTKYDQTSLLDAIMNPDAALVFGYEPWLIELTDGTSLFGFILSENQKVLVVKDASGKQSTLPVRDVRKKTRQSKSLMPDPASLNLSGQDLADILSYLLNT